MILKDPGVFRFPQQLNVPADSSHKNTSNTNTLKFACVMYKYLRHSQTNAKLQLPFYTAELMECSPKTNSEVSPWQSYRKTFPFRRWVSGGWEKRWFVLRTPKQTWVSGPGANIRGNQESTTHMISFEGCRKCISRSACPTTVQPRQLCFVPKVCGLTGLQLNTANPQLGQ